MNAKSAPIESPDSSAELTTGKFNSQNVRCNSKWPAKCILNADQRRNLMASMRYWHLDPPSSKLVQQPKRSRYLKRQSSQFTIVTLQILVPAGTPNNFESVCRALWIMHKRKVGGRKSAKPHQGNHSKIERR